ncbi:S-layer homology domain-containing protein [Demequina rhizosphaerae]|uniref:S-layer homology domain-containing protein n=1 Tax=Demequina rhizosphaerae TaxID=1638985 RepID=UPI00078405F9|nr:S-layer homology domain-containing protein [Demequina rhizosphaerae]
MQSSSSLLARGAAATVLALLAAAGLPAAAGAAAGTVTGASCSAVTEGHEHLADVWCYGAETGASATAPRTLSVTETVSITGTVVVDGEPAEGWAELFSWDGEYLGDVDIVEGAYTFADVAEGEYKVLVGTYDDHGSQWAELDGSDGLGPAKFVVSPESPAEIVADEATLGDEPWVYFTVAGKGSWSTDRLCLAAYDAEDFWDASISAPVSTDCAVEGNPTFIDELDKSSEYLLRIVPAELATADEWMDYEGDEFWFGNVADPWTPGALVFITDTTTGPDWHFVAYFGDVKGGAKAFDEISWLAAFQIASGYDDDTFRPRESVTRRNMAKLLYRYAGRPDFEMPEESPFTDLEPGDGGYRAMVWLYEAEIASGYADGSFKPNKTVSRQNMAKFLYRYAGRPDVDMDEKSPFKDVKKTAGGYRALKFMVDEEIASGFSDGTIRPNQDVIRRQMATFLYRFPYL